MWPVLRKHVFLQVKHGYRWNHRQTMTTVKSCYQITYNNYQFKVSKKQPLCREFSNGDTGKRYDRYFHFIHQNDLYRNTTLNYNILSELQCKETMPNLLSKIVVPTSSLGKNMQQLTDDELQQVMIYLITGKLSRSLKILHYLDEECAKRTLKWTVVTSLYMLDGWIMVDEKFTFNGKFFNVLRNLWCQQLQHCTKENLVQIVYYLGRSKRPAPTLLSDRMENLLLQRNQDITLNEWGIICNGFFKMKTKIKSTKLLHHIADFVVQHLKHHDKYILISVLKAFRHACYFDEVFIRFLENFARETYSDYNVLECAHFLAMFANVGWYNQEIFDSLEMQAINKLVSARETTDAGSNGLSLSEIRIKDVARLLWSISHTVHKPKSVKFFETVTNTIKEFMSKDFNKNLPHIVDCAQSLIVMGYFCDDILQKLLTKDTFQKLRHSVKRKPFNQLYFIYSSVGIEASISRNLSEDIFEIHSPLKSAYKDTRERLGIEQLIMVMQRYCTENEEFTHSFVLPHITISNVCIQVAKADSEHLPDNTSNSGKKHMKICLEVLDPTVCLENHEHRMTGLMVTKVRQLRKLDYGVVLLTPEAVKRLTEMTTDNLRVYIDNLFIKVMAQSVVTIK